MNTWWILKEQPILGEEKAELKREKKKEEEEKSH